MRIAIIGAGFCGLATARYLLNYASVKVTLFDEKGIGGGASGIAAGLLHPYAGAHSKLNRRGREGVETSLELLKLSANALNKPVTLNKGILRLALTDMQIEDFKKCASVHSEDTDWLDEKECKALYPHLADAPGLLIKNGLTIQSKLYLEGLWEACISLGATHIRQSVHSLREMEEFDAVILTAGAGHLNFPELARFSLRPTKGQILELEWPQGLPTPPLVLNSQAYLVMSEDQKRCYAGATFEKSYANIEADEATAKADILPKIVAMLPELHSAKVIGCAAGLRIATPSHLPLLADLGGNRWLLTGMGSKGLLYHALYAKELAAKIVAYTNI
jgi:glycine/D-amino acid oxidase-like deaminating enzyme